VEHMLWEVCEVLYGRIVVPSHIGLRSNLALEVALQRCDSSYVFMIRPLKECLYRNLVWFTQFVISSVGLRDRLSRVNKNMRALLIQFCNPPLWSLDKEVTRADIPYVSEIVDVMDEDCLSCVLPRDHVHVLAPQPTWKASARRASCRLPLAL
jgi:hypothetical protein